MPYVDYQFEQERLKRNRDIADALLKQSEQPIGDTQMVSGIAVRRSPMEGFAKLGEAWAGKSLADKAEAEMKQLGQTRDADLISALEEYNRATTQRPAMEAGDPKIPGDQRIDPAYTPTDADKKQAGLSLAMRIGGREQVARSMAESALRTPEIKAYKPGDVLYQDGRQVGSVARQPNWQRTELPLSDGTKRVGFVDTNAADPLSTFKEGGTENPEQKLAPGGQFYNPRAVQPGAVMPDPNKPFGLGADGKPVANTAFQNYETGKAAAGAARTTVVTKQEGEEAKTVGKGFGEQYVDLQRGAMAAQGKLTNIARMEQLMQGVNTGALVPTAAQVSGIARTLGFNIDPNLGPKQAVEALSNEMALALRNPAGGAGMPGAMSDKDREFLVSMTPGLGRTPEGNALMMQTAKKLAQREIEVAAKAREYRGKRGQLDEGFYNELAAWSAQNPLFTAPSGGGTNPAVDAALRKYQ